MSEPQQQTKKPATPPQTKTAADLVSAKMCENIRRRWTEADIQFVIADEVAKEYEPRVGALEAQLADLLKRLGEDAKGKGGK